jgi:hypothetical protein
MVYIRIGVCMYHTLGEHTYTSEVSGYLIVSIYGDRHVCDERGVFSFKEIKLRDASKGSHYTINRVHWFVGHSGEDHWER